MALSPDEKFIYVNPDTTPGEHNTAQYFPVKYLRGLECTNTTFCYLYFRGPKNAYSTRVQISIMDGFVKEFFTQFVNEVNFGEASVITLADRNIAVDSTTGGTDFIHVNAFVIPSILTDSNLSTYEDVQVVGNLDIGGSLQLDLVTLSAVQKSTDSFVDNDTSLMTSAAIDDRINAAGGSVSVSDSTANTDFPVVFHDESNNLHDDTGAFEYNPSSGNLTVTTVNGGTPVTAGAVSVSSGSQTSVGVQIARRTITQAEANAMNSTPIELIPAQGANTVIVILGGMIRVDRAATQTSVTATLHFHYEGEEPGTIGQSLLYHHRRFMYNETTDRVFHICPALGSGGIEVADSLTEDVNAAVEASFSSAITTNSVNSIDVYLNYQVIDIS